MNFSIPQPIRPHGFFSNDRVGEPDIRAARFWAKANSNRIVGRFPFPRELMEIGQPEEAVGLGDESAGEFARRSLSRVNSASLKPRPVCGLLVLPAP
jgi:hypothetical protein